MIPKMEWYGKNEQYINVSIGSRCASLSDKVINKALMIAMNYLMENMETEDKESAE